MVRFNNAADEGRAPHQFRVYDLEADDTDLVGEIAELVRELYVDVERLGNDMRTALDGLGPVADVTRLNELIDKVLDSVIPAGNANSAQPPQLNLARNELAEVLAYEVVSQIHTATIPAKRVHEKEIPGQPSRGLDLLSILHQEPTQLLVTEVKASQSPVSPPAVVGYGNDSLRRQTLDILNDHRRLTQELNWAHKHCKPSDRQLVATTLLRLTLGQLQLVAAPVLVRTSTSYSRSDFGSFENSPGDFAPANIDFVIVRVAGTIHELASDVYDRARAAE